MQSYGKEPKMDTTQITPGTEFMKKLSQKIISYFDDPLKFGVKELIVSVEVFGCFGMFLIV